MKTILVLGFWSCSLGFVVRAQSVTLRDSLTQQVKTLPNDTNRVIALNELGFQYRQSKPERTYRLAQQAYSLSRTLQYPVGEARALATMAAAFKFLGDYAKSLTLYNQAKEINQRINDIDRVAVILNNTADLYMQQGEWQKGLATMRQCFAIYKTLRNPRASSKSVYLTNLAECFYHLNQLDSAAVYLSQALPLATANQEGIRTAVYYLLGDVALAQNKIDTARRFYAQSISVATQLENYSDLYEGYYRMTRLDEQMGQRANAFRTEKLALAYAQRATYAQGVLTSSQHLTTLYEGNNDTESLRYYKMAVAAKDSLYSQDKLKRLLSITFREKEQAQQTVAVAAAYQTKISFAILIGVLSVLAGFALVLWINNRQK